MRFRALALHTLLTLLLLLSQQLGVSHSLTHLSSLSSLSHLSHTAEKNSSRDEPLPGDLQCASCLAFAAIGAALNGVTHAGGIDTGTCAIAPGIRPATPLNDPLHAFQPRAPPALS